MLATLALALRGSPARAQDGNGFPEPAHAAPSDGPARCNGERVREIVVAAAAPTVARIDKVPVIGPLARSTHVTTRTEVLRGYLLLEVGKPCTELARAESERVLRAQPFIADADIAVIPVDSGVRVEVRTIDEASLVFGSSVRAAEPFLRSLRLGNSNLAGMGIHLRGEWREGRGARDGGAITFADHLFLGRPHLLNLHVERAPLGGEWQAHLTRPFFTGLQREAWRAGAGEMVTYTELRHPDSATHVVRVQRSYADAGLMARIGPPVRMGFLGLQLSHEREVVGQTLYIFAPDGSPVAADSFAAPRPYESTRLNAFIGARRLSFERVEGFDALTATQDIPVGFQAGLVVGRGLDAPAEGFGRELFLSADLYAGRGDTNDATRVQLRAQGTRSATDGRWGRGIATGRLAHQIKPSANHTVALSGDWAATWRAGAPLQLMVGARDGGVRGYADALMGGGHRAVLRLEERFAIPNVRGAGDLGVAAFADVGRVWRGGAPFGVTTPIQPSLGLSLLGAVPARSARMWRLDVAMPLDGPALNRITLGLTRGDRSAVFWREPGDLASTRGPTVPSSVFAWP